MRVLIGCEFSGVVRRAFRALGHDAYSCDLLPAEDGSPYHIQGDVLEVIDESWGMLIGHPPCTYLANSGVSWLYKDAARWDRMREAANFFRMLLDAPVPLKCIENPIMHKHAVEIIGRRQTQIVQPWMFGHTEQKATGLWLEGLPELVPTGNVRAEMMKLPANKRQRLHYLPPSADRQRERSRTFAGIAEAMAMQWGGVVKMEQAA